MDLVESLISISKASEVILDNVPFLSHGEVTLAEAFGRILAEDIRADRPIPPYDRVMMDGIAIAHASYAGGRCDFHIAGTQAAGSPALELTDPGACIEVMTGAPLPVGTDTVIKVEDVAIENSTASLRNGVIVRKNQHIHPLGSDQDTGATLVPAGSFLSAPEIAIAASVGRTRPLVYHCPSILLITTGDEVIPPEDIPEPHQIRRSHYPAIRACIEPNRLGKMAHTHVPDSPADVENALQKGIGEFDVVLITGGISKGKFDHVRPVLEKLAGPPAFHGVAQRPGKPFAFWAGPKPIFALPGNPVSVMACLARYVLPALRKMRGESWTPPSFPLAQDLIWNAPFPGLVACRISQNQILPQPPRNSGDYTALAHSQGVCESQSTSRAGTLLKFYPW